MRPRAGLLRFGAIWLIYRERLRAHPVQEALAGVGIAVGVALVFAVQVSSQSVSASARQITQGVTGAAQLQLAARDARGFPMSVVDDVQHISGVVRAAPLLEQRAVLVSPDGRRQVPVNLASADPRLAALSGALTSNFPIGALATPGVMLPVAVSDDLGFARRTNQTIVRPRPEVTVELRGRRIVAPVTSVLGQDTVGPLADARVAVAPLAYLQAIAGLPNRVTRVLVEVAPGKTSDVRQRLLAVADGRLSVASVNADAQLLARATGPDDQAAAFFAAISVLVGLLLALNAMLLTAPERRRVIAEMRLTGFRPSQVVQAFMVQALVLGALASALGLAVGNLLARTVLHASPDYLASVFPIGGQTVVSVRAVALSVVGGLLVTCLAASPPLLELRRATANDGAHRQREEPGAAITDTMRRRLFVAALVMLAATNGLLLLMPSAAFVAGAGLALSTLLVIPTALKLVLDLAERVAASSARMNPLMAAVLGLRATTGRALALAAIGAVAVFGSLALEGSRRDLLHGLYRGYADYAGTTQVWLVNRTDDLATKDIRADDLAKRVAAVPGVKAVRPYFGSFLDYSGQRVWVIGRPAADSAMIPRSQIRTGDPGRASALLRRGGWIAISEQIAAAHRLGLGDRIAIPTPSGTTRFRIAATTTNLGWTSGAMVLDARDYQRAWQTHDPSAFEVDLISGTRAATVLPTIRAVLGSDSGLLVQSTRQRSEQANALARQGLARLTEIALLLVIAAALAMAAAMGTSIWQRRPRLAGMRLQGYRPAQLWRILLVESFLVLGTGCAVGVALGTYGQWLSDHWLTRTTGFPTIFSVLGWETFVVVSAVVTLALAIVAVPGWIAAHAPKHLGLQEPV
jgi:putative ABC transport system permease protein